MLSWVSSMYCVSITLYICHPSLPLYWNSGIGVDLISYVYIGTLVMIMLESENICICLLSC